MAATSPERKCTPCESHQQLPRPEHSRPETSRGCAPCKSHAGVLYDQKRTNGGNGEHSRPETNKSVSAACRIRSKRMRAQFNILVMLGCLMFASTSGCLCRHCLFLVVNAPAWDLQGVFLVVLITAAASACWVTCGTCRGCAPDQALVRLAGGVLPPG